MMAVFDALRRNPKDQTIQALLQQVSKALRAVSDTSRLDAEVLLAFALKKPRVYLYTWPQHRITSDLVQTFLELSQRRYLGEPIAYLVGCREFWRIYTNSKIAGKNHHFPPENRLNIHNCVYSPRTFTQMRKL